MTLKEKILNFMRKNNLSQKQFAVLAGVSIATVQRILQNRITDVVQQRTKGRLDKILEGIDDENTKVY